MNKRRDTMAAVSRIGELVAMTLDTSEILRHIVEITAEIMKVDVCSIYLWDSDEGSLVLEATRGLKEDAIGHVKILPGEGITGRAAKQGRIVAVRDVTMDRRNMYFPITGEDRYRSLLSVPLRFKDELIGVMNVQTENPRSFRKSERRLLKTIAHQVSGAIHNARLYESVLEGKKEIERTHERLVESEKMAALGRLSATLSHELRNPLAGLKGASQLLARKTGNHDERRQYIDLILEEIERLDRIVEDLLQFARPGKLRLEQVDINKMIDDILLLHSDDFNGRGITIRKRLSKLPNIRADRDKFKQVLVNIVLNARDAMPEGGELLVSSGVISNEPESRDIVTLQFRDNGQGIEENVLRSIFEPFFTTKPDGVGLGLAVCKAIIEDHKGRISIRSLNEGSDIRGTVVTVEIPSLEIK
ncbi:GAF domain-containing protein [bacterium]|nr:GAF domain-containing protein [bacterium]